MRSPAAGLGDGAYTLGSVGIDVRDGVVRRSDGVLAGSALTMIEAVRNLVELGVPLERAVDAAIGGACPRARASGIGRLAPGSPADIVVLDDALAIDRVDRGR